MTLTLDALKTEIGASADYKDLQQQEWLGKIDYRDITHRSQKDFDWLIPMYVRKIDACRWMQQTGGMAIEVVPSTPEGFRKTKTQIAEEIWDHLQKFYDKELRMLDKLAVCLKEVEYRKAGVVTRTDLHDQANYYIDYAGGDDANTGLSTVQAWKTITQYTTTTVRTPGDIAYLRANVTWTQGTEAVSISFDEDGNQDLWIKIIGCDAVTNDPWADASNVKPIVDFQDLAYNFGFNGDTYWYMERLDIRQSANTTGQVNLVSALVYLKSCDVSDSASASAEGMYVTNGSYLTCNACTFTDCWGNSLFVVSGRADLINCTLDAGTIRGSLSAITAWGNINVIDCSIAPSNTFSGNEIYSLSGIVNCRNVTFGVAADILCVDSGIVNFEDYDGTYGDHRQLQTGGWVTKETTSPRAGGSDSYARLTPNSSCGPNQTLRVGYRVDGVPSGVWLASGVEKTITIYARTGSAWDSALTAGQAYLTASYLSNGASAARTDIQSAETITNDAAWTAFTVTFTPLQAGFAYYWFELAEYEDATEYVDVDMLAVVS